MKHLTLALSALSFLLACSAATEEGAAPAAGGTTGFAGGGAGGTLATAGTAGQSGGAGGSVVGSSGAAGATAGTGGSSAAGAGGVAGASGAAGQGGISAGGTSGAGGTGGSGGAGGAAQSPEQALYTTNCSACHGATGEGGPMGPEIRHPVEDFTTWMVRNGSEPRNPDTTYPAPMIPLDTTMVSDTDLAMVMTYLNSFPQPTTGPELYADYCANCHGADGKGGPTTRDLTNLANPLATEVPEHVRDGAHAGEFEMLIEYMPARDMTVLTDAELMLIATHIETL